MKYLLIYELVPGETTFYELPEDVYMKYSALLELAHGKMINLDDDNDGTKFVNDAVGTPEHASCPENGGVLAQYEVGVENLSGPYAKVVWSGFVL